jgi:hypothetical protein
MPNFTSAEATSITTTTSVYTANGIHSVIIGANLANTSEQTATADVSVNNGAQSVYLAKNVSIPAGGAVEVIAPAKTVLRPGYAIEVTSTQSVDAYLSVLEGV